MCSRKLCLGMRQHYSSTNSRARTTRRWTCPVERGLHCTGQWPSDTCQVCSGHVDMTGACRCDDSLMPKKNLGQDPRMAVSRSIWPRCGHACAVAAWRMAASTSVHTHSHSFKHVCLHIHSAQTAHAYAHTHAHAHKCTRTHKRARALAHAHTNTHTHTHTHTLTSQTHKHMCAGTHTYIRVRAHTKTQTCVHTRTHT